MAQLIMEIGLPHNFAFDSTRYVNMDVWGYSASTPLATTGAGPCLNVVIHKRTTNAGCLAHVAHTSTNQAELFMKALDAILIMALKLALGATPFDIWFGAGWAFAPGGSGYTPARQVSIDFVTFIRQQLAMRNYTSVEILDCRTPGNVTEYDPGNVAYWPALNRVYIITRGTTPEGYNDDRDLHGVQTGKAPPEGGKLI
jgi:hypothetical protein